MSLQRLRQLQALASRRGAEAPSLVVGTPGLVASNSGPLTVVIESVVLKFPNGTSTRCRRTLPSLREGRSR